MKKRKPAMEGKQSSSQHLVHGELPQFPGGLPADRVFSKNYTKAKLKPLELRFQKLDK